MFSSGISRSRRVLAILLAGPCEKAEREAEKEAFPAEKAMIALASAICPPIERRMRDGQFIDAKIDRFGQLIPHR